MKLFTSPLYPALLVRVQGRSFKFAGGKLRVADEDAELVQRFADAHALYELTASEVPSERKELQAELRAIGEKTGGTNEELAERLSVAHGDMV